MPFLRSSNPTATALCWTVEFDILPTECKATRITYAFAFIGLYPQRARPKFKGSPDIHRLHLPRTGSAVLHRRRIPPSTRITSSAQLRPYSTTDPLNMVKPLVFKGDKKPKKRKRVAEAEDTDAPTSKALTIAQSDAAPDDDSWVDADAPTDISGPIIIVLPTEPPTCLACDAIGKVFCSEIENVVEGNPATAEPHDVRQVWVASRVAGSEGFNLKGHHGR